MSREYYQCRGVRCYVLNRKSCFCKRERKITNSEEYAHQSFTAMHSSIFENILVMVPQSTTSRFPQLCILSSCSVSIYVQRFLAKHLIGTNTKKQFLIYLSFVQKRLVKETYRCWSSQENMFYNKSGMCCHRNILLLLDQNISPHDLQTHNLRNVITSTLQLFYILYENVTQYV